MSIMAKDKRKVIKKEQLAAKHQAAFAAFFRMQKTLLLSKLMEGRSLAAPDKIVGKDPAVVGLQARLDDIWKSVVSQTNPTLQRIVIDAEMEAMVAGANYAGLSMVGPKLDPNTFTLANTRAVDWFRTTGGSLAYINGIQDTTLKQLKTMVGDAIDTGQPYTELARDIGKKFTEYSAKLPGKQMSRSQLIATTEIGTAYEEGNAEFAQNIEDGGIEMEKLWVTSHDDKVSDGCQANEDLGWVEMDYEYPDEGVTQPPRFPGCRCYQQYRQKGREE